jgi:hypothetical protein
MEFNIGDKVRVNKTWLERPSQVLVNEYRNKIGEISSGVDQPSLGRIKHYTVDFGPGTRRFWSARNLELVRVQNLSLI